MDSAGVEAGAKMFVGLKGAPAAVPQTQTTPWLAEASIQLPCCPESAGGVARPDGGCETDLLPLNARSGHRLVRGFSRAGASTAGEARGTADRLGWSGGTG